MSAVQGVAGSGAVPSNVSTAGNNPLNQLDNTQTFLQLLVAQLQNQNPLNPTNPTSFMTEIAQLTQVQSQTNLTADEQTVAADSMIGKDVVGTSTTGSPVDGVVSGVTLSTSGSPTLDVGGSQVDLSMVTQVQAAPAGTGATSTGSSTGSGSSTGTGSSSSTG